ncbi:GGDEF domain-containing protein [Pontivivens ytuae]|uniref:diguanylate cyclase n=1 Tax=Pontivivens ytuae TaxID=2789856 RepID=A0A7S9LUA3_9RHOB|nr:GGDEF domain-containing protein [Pontivivens ytuae]QPH55389.1 GGDEF domain-containing protein [Pontivivens ytuae]
MERLVDYLAPRGPLDWVLKTALFIAAINGLNLTVEFAMNGALSMSLLAHVQTTSMVAFPFTLFALSIIRHQHRLQGQLKHLATTDMLTGLPNRRELLRRLGEERRSFGAFILLDIDHFKRINDRHGHAVGDTCLVRCAAHLSGSVGPGDVVARYGGEEFAVLARTRDPAALEALTTRLCEPFTCTVAVEGLTVPMTLSAGVVRADADLGYAELLRDADAALYHAKDTGRNRAVFAPGRPAA